MSNLEEIKQLKASLKEAENVQADLDRRVFHLKTLYDVSKDIYSSVESEAILRNFLLMTMGNFGVMEGFIILLDTSSKEISQLVSFGIHDDDIISLKNYVILLLVILLPITDRQLRPAPVFRGPPSSGKSQRRGGPRICRPLQ